MACAAGAGSTLLFATHGYTVFGQQLGCTSLHVAAHHPPPAHMPPNTTTAPARRLVKLVAPSRKAAFLQGEGHVLRMLQRHPHPCLLTPLELIDTSTSPHPACTAAALAAFPPVGQNLHLHVREQSRLCEAEARGVFRQLVDTVAHCHRHRIILRDMKLGKVFFAGADKRRIVIADLEGAQVVPADNPLLTDQKGSPAYVSPEVLACQPYCGAASDMWALGVMLHVLLTGTYPFQDERPAALFQRIQRASAAVSFPPHLSLSVRSLICSLLQRDASRRPRAAQLLRSDPWLNDSPAPPLPVDEDGERAPGACPTDAFSEQVVPGSADARPSPPTTPSAASKRARARRKRRRPAPFKLPPATAAQQQHPVPPLLSPGIESAALSKYRSSASASTTNNANNTNNASNGAIPAGHARASPEPAKAVSRRRAAAPGGPSPPSSPLLLLTLGSAPPALPDAMPAGQ